MTGCQSIWLQLYGIIFGSCRWGVAEDPRVTIVIHTLTYAPTHLCVGQDDRHSLGAAAAGGLGLPTMAEPVTVDAAGGGVDDSQDHQEDL